MELVCLLVVFTWNAEMCGMQICSVAMPFENPLTDLSEMNNRSATVHKESSCQLSYPCAKAFSTIKLPTKL
jgi:hypothetical protein